MWCPVHKRLKIDEEKDAEETQCMLIQSHQIWFFSKIWILHLRQEINFVLLENY